MLTSVVAGPVGSVVYDPQQRSPTVDDGPYPHHDYDRNQLISLLGGQRRILPTLQQTEAETAHDTVAYELQHTARKYKAAFASRTPRLSKLAAYRTGNTRVGHFPGTDLELVRPFPISCARPADQLKRSPLHQCLAAGHVRTTRAEGREQRRRSRPRSPELLLCVIAARSTHRATSAKQGGAAGNGT